MKSFTVQDWLLLIGALGVVIVNIVNSFRSVAKSDTILTKVAEVHDLTNSNMSKAENKIDKQTSELETLKELINDLRNERDKKILVDVRGVALESREPVEVKGVDGAPVKVTETK